MAAGRLWNNDAGHWFVELAEGGYEAFGADEAKARAFAVGYRLFFDPADDAEVLQQALAALLQHGYDYGCVMTRGLKGQLDRAKQNTGCYCCW